MPYYDPEGGPPIGGGGGGGGGGGFALPTGADILGGGFPWGAAVSGGIGILGQVFRKKRRIPGPFQFSLDENDPELAWARRNALLSGQRTARQTMDEVGRENLYGTRTARDLIHQNQLDTERAVTGVEGSIYGARRGEAHDEYMARLNHALGIDSADYNAELGGMANLGGLAGSSIQDWIRRNQYLRRARMYYADQGGPDAYDQTNYEGN